ncbi:MAG: iron-containing redox enzyme family protein [Myxococcales bacterium]|nr:iron-containing redox enzyme family protein [Myxococcales bacterium]
MSLDASCARSGLGGWEPIRQYELTKLNQQRLCPGVSTENWREELAREALLREKEGQFVEELRAMVAPMADLAPSDGADFMEWFSSLEAAGPGQHDPLFEYLAEHASLDEMRWFLRQEVAGEAGFDDLVALTQVRLPERAKLELARNYWDEMGRGKRSAMHGPMLARLAEELDIREVDPAATVWESLALSNLLVALAANRRYAYQSVGALGVVEMTAPGRAAKVNAGLERLGVGGRARQYFALHATLDVQHSRTWNREVIEPLVAFDADLTRPLAEGALMRLLAGQRCFERYRRQLFVSDSPESRRGPRRSGRGRSA